MNQHLHKLENQLIALNKASILEKAEAVAGAMERLVAVLRDFEDRIAALEGRIDEQETT